MLFPFSRATFWPLPTVDIIFNQLTAECISAVRVCSVFPALFICFSSYIQFGPLSFSPADSYAFLLTIPGYRKLPCLCPLTPHKVSIDFPFLFIHYPIFFARGCLIVAAVHGGNQAALNWSLRLAIASQHSSYHIRTA